MTSGGSEYTALKYEKGARLSLSLPLSDSTHGDKRLCQGVVNLAGRKVREIQVHDLRFKLL